MKRKFSLGKIVRTIGAGDLDYKAILVGLNRHSACDWGIVPDSDKKLNDEAVGTGGRLLSAYGDGEKKFWIITEADRSSTCVLLPEEY